MRTIRFSVGVLTAAIALGVIAVNSQEPDSSPIRINPTTSTTDPGASVPPLPTGTALITITATGGECPQGACGQTIVIGADGDYEARSGTKVRRGHLDLDLTDRLRKAAASTSAKDFKPVAKDYQCPVVYDGQEYTLEFRDVTVKSCTQDFDNDLPIVVAMYDVLEKVHLDSQS